MHVHSGDSEPDPTCDGGPGSIPGSCDADTDGGLGRVGAACMSRMGAPGDHGEKDQRRGRGTGYSGTAKEADPGGGRREELVQPWSRGSLLHQHEKEPKGEK
jgi:hypothetical protein